jgi:hypothetical protein
VSAGWTIVTDGEAVSVALARWLARHGGGTIIEARGASDLPVVLDARRRAEPNSRLTVIADRKMGGTDASEAKRIAAGWLENLSPIETRTDGADVLERHVHADEPGSEPLRNLLLSSVPVPPTRPKVHGRRRGRPPGLNPFHGSGFEVCSLLLLETTKEWTARAVAAQVERAPSLVQRAFGELERRGLLEQLRRGVRLTNPLLLRDELLQAWTARVGTPRREAQAYIVAKRGDLQRRVLEAAQRAGARCILAGPSAVEGPAALIGDPLTVYCDAEAGFLGAGFERASGLGGDLVVWTPPERMVFLRPRTLGKHQATNRLVTFLDLAASGSERHRAAAEAVWQSER